ncbi:MAG TPA: fused MFS/spermidine synthase [Bradyrhizobium sp.]|nr:fused MFS/spermidine synthase [Bradyrhizobium sp.]
MTVAVETKAGAVSSNVQYRAFSAIFFLSGATSLVYQIAWMRKLSLFFGSDVYSTAVTLGAFMAGLCAGSWLAGRLGRRLTRPLFAYGAIEIGVAIYALAFAAILGLFDPLLTDIYQRTFVADSAIYQIVRAAIAFAILLPPTALMGATLPLVIQHFAVADRILGSRLGYFYATNTIGALVGTLAAGFVLLPRIGVTATVVMAAAINAAIGLAGLWLGTAAGPVKLETAELSVAQNKPQMARVLVLAAMAMSGFAALALEVSWTRVLVQSFSATVYAFAIMLVAFLFGIYWGSLRESGVVDRRERPAARLVMLEFGLSAYVAALSVLTYLVPSVFGFLVWSLTAVTAGNFGLASVIAQFVAASILIIPATIMLGATFPLAIKIYSRDIRERAGDTGTIYAANTFGALLGSLAGGFLLIPAFGVHGSLIAIACFFLLAALILNPLGEKPRDRRQTFIAGTAVAVGVACGAAVLVLPQQTVVNFNMQRSTHPEVIYHGEGVSHTVDIVRTPTQQTLMMIDGNIEADTTLIQRRHFILKAHLPLLLNRDPRDVAVVGLGLGVTLSATTHNPAVDHIQVIELTPEMLRAQQYLRHVTDNVLANPKVSVLIDDGRNFLNRSTAKFDVITADPIHPRISGVGYLYTREYYEAVRSHLRPGGYILQWMPMYAISRKSFDVAFRTFAGVFPNASFWYVRGHGLFVAGLDKFTIDYQALRERFAAPEVRRDFESIGLRSPEELMSHLLMDDQHIASYLQAEESLGPVINTDDDSYLEYATPHEFLERTKSIVDALAPFAGWDRSRLVGASPSELALIEDLSAKRLSVLDSELEQPVE